MSSVTSLISVKSASTVTMTFLVQTMMYCASQDSVWVTEKQSTVSLNQKLVTTVMVTGNAPTGVVATEIRRLPWCVVNLVLKIYSAMTIAVVTTCLVVPDAVQTTNASLATAKAI